MVSPQMNIRLPSSGCAILSFTSQLRTPMFQLFQPPPKGSSPQSRNEALRTRGV